MYNLLRRQAEVEILPMAQALGLAAIVYGPTAGGLLTGKYADSARPAATRFAEDPVYQNRYADASSCAAAEAFTALAGEMGVAPATLAVAWAGSHPAVTSVLLGARTVEQLDAGLAAADLVLDEAACGRVAAITPTPPPATDRSEERAVRGERQE